MAVFDDQLDHVLINLCNYSIDDADDVVQKLFTYNMITSFCQLRTTPPLDIGLWKIGRGNGLFVPVLCSIHLSLSNVIYYASALEKSQSNNPPWDDATQWTSDAFDKWVLNDKDTFLASGNAPVNNNAFAFGAPAGGALAASNKTDQNAIDMFNKRPPNQTLYEKLTNNSKYSSWLVVFKRQATFDYFVRVLDKNNKAKLCRPGADLDVWDLQVNFLGIILKKTSQTEKGISLTARFRDDPRKCWFENHKFQTKSDTYIQAACAIISKLYKIKVTSFPTRSSFLTGFDLLVQSNDDISTTLLDTKTKWIMLSSAIRSGMTSGGLNHTYMNFVSHQRYSGQPLQAFTDLHQYVLDYDQILNNHTPLVSPPRHSRHYNSFPSNSNSGDEFAMLSAYLSNLGCDNNMLRHFEVFAGQLQRRPPH